MFLERAPDVLNSLGKMFEKFILSRVAFFRRFIQRWPEKSCTMPQIRLGVLAPRRVQYRLWVLLLRLPVLPAGGRRLVNVIMSVPNLLYQKLASHILLPLKMIHVK